MRKSSSFCTPPDVKGMQQVFPMYVMPISHFLQQSQFEVHEELMNTKNALVEWKPGMNAVIFLSHSWLGAHHPDKAGIKFRLVKKLLHRILDGKVKIDTFYLHQFFFEAQTISAGDLKECLSCGYIWMDFQSVPQSNAHGMQMACDSIPCYVQQSSYFFCVAPPATHENGSHFDYRTWCKRGWCRAERLFNMLSPEIKPVIVVESLSAKYIAMSRDWVCHPVGCGDFTVPDDKRRLGPVIADAVEKAKLQALEQNNLTLFRLLSASKNILLEGCSRTDSDNIALEDWMAQMHFKSVHDENASGWTPLRFAMYEGRLDIAQQMLDQAVDVDAPLMKHEPLWGYHNKGCTIISGLSFMRHCPEGIRLLLSCQADPYRGMTGGPAIAALHVAAGSGQIGNMDAIMEMRPSTTMKNTDDDWLMYPWRVAIIWGQKDAYRHYRCKYAHLVDADEQGKNLFGWPICFLAVQDVGDLDTLKAVVADGFDINCQVDILHTSAQGYAMIKMSQAKCFMNEDPDNFSEFWANSVGMTALLCAAFFGNSSALRSCVESGADIKVTNSYGRSALMLAAMKGHSEIVEALLMMGAPLDVVDTWGLSACQWATKRGHPEIAAQIEAAGATMSMKSRACSCCADLAPDLQILVDDTESSSRVVLCQLPVDVRAVHDTMHQSGDVLRSLKQAL